MTYGVTRVASTKSFTSIDSKSVLTGNTQLCGPIKLTIVEAYSFATVTSGTSSGTISVQTNDFGLINSYTVTIEAELENYPTIAHVQVAFTLNIVHPCSITTLTLPTTLQAVSITSLSGISNSQLFLPATDPESIANSTKDLCGNRIYTIIDPLAQGIVTITSPAIGLDPYIDKWTLTCQSTSLADVGVRTFTLQAVLESWP